MKSVNGEPQQHHHNHHYYPSSSPSSSSAAHHHQNHQHLQTMPHYGLGGGYVQTPPSPPTQQSGQGGGPGPGHLGNSALLPTSPSHHMGLMSRMNYTNNQSPSGPGGGPGHGPGHNPGSQSIYSSRTFEEKSLTREAMEKYMRERNDMVIVILHAKVGLKHDCMIKGLERGET